MDNTFAVLQRKEIYEFLGGSGNQELVTYNGKSYGLPYRSVADLNDICRAFGVTVPLGGVRWTYVESLIQHVIDNDRCDEVLAYLFALDQFDNLNGIQDMDEVEKLHNQIVIAAVQRINQLIRLTRKELMLISGHYYISDAGTRPVIQTPRVDTISVSYIRGLRERCEDDLTAGNYDSVITKSRTVMEETLIYILEQNNVAPSTSGKIRDLYNQVKQLRNMQQSSHFDNRINGLLSGLEKVVQNIGDMRNINSDAHGVGSGRITIREKEARLVMNSAIIFCEYLL